MTLSRRAGGRWLRLICGCVLVVAGAFGGVWSLRAATAQHLYKRAKYGLWVGTRFERPPRADPKTILRDCERAQAWYPRNHYFPVLAAASALGGALTATHIDDFERLFGAAEHWCRVAVDLNPYSIDAMHVKCRLLREKGDMAGAIAFWRDVVLEREFWNPDHHETYVTLLLKAGETTKAIEAARWLRGGPVRQKVRQIEQARPRPLPTE
jgi:hypothetical protein